MSVLGLKIFRLIEQKFYIYGKLVEAVVEAKDLALHGTPRKDKTGGFGRCFVSDPTAQRGVALADPIAWVELDGVVIKRPEDWLMVIDATGQRYRDTQIGDLLGRRYFLKQDAVLTCKEMGINRATYYNWRDDIIIYAGMAACQKNILKVF